jgi:hypothetical protein
MAMPNLLVCFHVLGQTEMVKKLIQTVGFTFDSVSNFLSEATVNLPYTSMEQLGHGGGVLSLKRLLWHIQSFIILHLDLPVSKAIAWCKSLPDDETFIQCSMTMPTHDHGSLLGCNHQTCFMALAHEKVGLYEGALRFCRLALEPDLLKAGAPYSKWALTIASACQGRVLCKLNRYIEALVSFQAAIATSKESYPMMEAMAYRELANCDVTGKGSGHVAIYDYDAIDADEISFQEGDALEHVQSTANEGWFSGSVVRTGKSGNFPETYVETAAGVPAAVLEAVAQAGSNLEEKLKEFDGRLTRAEFDTLTIALPAEDDVF